MILPLIAGSLLLAVNAPAKPSSAGLYETGITAHQRGDDDAAYAAFSRLLAEKPDSGGALEGLTITCLSLGRNEEALGYARRWETLSPNSAYVLGLESRALRRLHRDEEALQVDRRIATLKPCDLTAQRRLDEAMSERRDGIFPQARISKSIGPEGLDTPSPQRIVYEGRSGGLRARKRLSATLDAVAGAEFSESAQRNDTGGFTYFDVLDQLYSLGLEGRPTRDLSWRAEYGQSLLSDVKGSGVGRTNFSRATLGGQWRPGPAVLSLTAERAPRYLRGAGGSRYFALLRESSARAEAEAPALGMDWLGRASIADLSEGTTLKNWSLTGTKEHGPDVFQPRYSHGQQEFYGAAPDGRLRYVLTDRLGLRWRRLVEDFYRLGTSYGYTTYRDGNRLHDFDAEAAAWLPWLKDFCGKRPLSAAYRYALEDYRVSADGYLSTDRRAHTLGAYWREGWGEGSETMLGYEHSFQHDSRGSYEGNAWLLEVEAYRRGRLSLKGDARVGASTVRDESYSAGLTARYSFE